MDTILPAQGLQLPSQLTERDREALGEILRRKLKGMPAAADITSRTLSLNEMERVEHVRWPYNK
jgi:hypothetical protein